MSDGWIELGEDDSVESVAYRNGHLPDTIWNASQNKALREKRTSMHVLLAGDRLFVPALESKTVNCATGRRHTFRRKAVPSFVEIRLVIGDQPIAKRPCIIDLPGRAPIETQTDADGMVRSPVMPDATEGNLHVTLANGMSMTFAIGPRVLDPVDTPSGLQARLGNLGYLPGEPSGVRDLATALALGRFQSDHGLDRTGVLDDVSKKKLIEVHGS